ncbi:MAG: hypothetical protein ACYDH4_11000 [Candidatus Cryosericum sp.]
MKRAVPAAAARAEASASKALLVSFFFARQPIVRKLWQNLHASPQGPVSSQK